MIRYLGKVKELLYNKFPDLEKRIGIFAFCHLLSTIIYSLFVMYFITELKFLKRFFSEFVLDDLNDSDYTGFMDISAIIGGWILSIIIIIVSILTLTYIFRLTYKVRIRNHRILSTNGYLKDLLFISIWMVLISTFNVLLMFQGIKYNSLTLYFTQNLLFYILINFSNFGYKITRQL